MSSTRVIKAKSIVNIIKIICTTLLLTATCSNIAYGGVGNFYKGEDRYRGFYWFEAEKTKSQGQDLPKNYDLTPEEAQTSIEARKKAMDNARAQMVELGFREDTKPHILRQAIIKYKKLEAKMHEGSIRLVYAAEAANFTNPEIADVTEFPTNVFANKIKRGIDEQQKITTIKEFAKKFDLLLFTNASCLYCKAFAPVINNFSKEHGFTLETATLESKEGKIAQDLGINGTPTLVAVSKEGKELFEISRGFSSVSELEASIILANNYSEEQRKKPKKNKRQ